MKRKTTVPKDLVNRNEKVLTIEHDSVVAPRFFCPADKRPFDAYMLSSGGVFEMARLEKSWDLYKQELTVYKTQYKYQEINDHF